MPDLPPLRQPDPHDLDALNSRINFERGIGLLLAHPMCPTCGELYNLIPGPGDQWLVDHVHRPWCPEDQDPDAVEAYVGDQFSHDDYRTSQAIWAASQENTP